MTGPDDAPDADADADTVATERIRAARRAALPTDAPFFDRGPGYVRLSGGATHADCDVL